MYGDFKSFIERKKLFYKESETILLMKIHCNGGFREVGRNAILVETKKASILLDSGIHVEDGEPPLPCKKVDAILLGHAHLDHIGTLPVHYKKFRAPVFSTAASFDQGHLLLNDSIKIARLKARPELFNHADLEKTMEHEKRVTFGQQFETNGILVDVYDAGHVPGSAIFVFEAEGKRIMYTSDFNTASTRLLNGASSKFKDIDVLIMENTYSNRDHPDRREQEKKLFASVNESILNEGIALLPVFAVGRGAEILMVLNSFKPKFPVYLDGMARDATEIILKYPELLRDAKELERAVERAIPLYTDEERRAAIKEPCAIVTTGGVIEGGPAIQYIKALYTRPECSINFTGYMIPKTAGRYLVDTGRFVHQGADLAVKMAINQFDFSVTPETPVLVRDKEKTKLCEIKNVSNEFDINSLECWAFDRKTLKGGWSKVSAIIKHNYIGKIFKIKTKTGRSVEITQGHSVFVLRNGKIEDVPGEQVKVGDYIAMPKKINFERKGSNLNFSKYFLKNNFNKERAPQEVEITNAFCRLMGYYAAEGHSIDRVGISLNEKTEQDLAEEISLQVGEFFPQLKVVRHNPSPSELQLRFGGTLTARIFADICGKGAHNKKAPDFIFESSGERIGEFAGAYLTGDGWFEEGKIRAKSVSKKLILDLIYLLSCMGITAKYDGIRISKERKAPHGTIFKESKSHVLRIQGIENLGKIAPFLRGKIRNRTESYLKKTSRTLSLPPHGLPVRELKLKDCIDGYNWRIEKILRSDSRNHINPNLIKSEKIKSDFLKNIINGDVAFDIVKSAEECGYSGDVYDLSVPGPQNFLGGFGGIFLHNSAHACRNAPGKNNLRARRPVRKICN